MNNKNRGFTLVELLAVIVIIGIIGVIVAPSVFKSKNTMNTAISDKEKKNIKDAANWLAVDLDDASSEIFNCKSGSWIANICSKSGTTWNKITNLTVKMLKENDYFVDSGNHINENCTLTIEKQSNGTYKVTLGSNC